MPIHVVILMFLLFAVQSRCKKAGVCSEAAFLAALHAYVFRVTGVSDLLFLHVSAHSDASILRLTVSPEDSLSGEKHAQCML
jgi:hypothetical protein